MIWLAKAKTAAALICIAALVGDGFAGMTLTVQAPGAEAPSRTETLAKPCPGYADPNGTGGGPLIRGGLQWIERVFPRQIRFVSTQGHKKPAILVMASESVTPVLHELSQRFPVDVVHHPFVGHNNRFENRDGFFERLKRRTRFDCFIMASIKTGTIPRDILYEILKRVRDDGAGLIVVDPFHYCPVIQRAFLNLKPSASGPAAIPGVPYEGLRQYVHATEMPFPTTNRWWTRGSMQTDPKVEPYEYKVIEIASFGKGQVVWIETGGNAFGRPLLPDIQMNRSMWVENDYYYSVVAKAIRRATGRMPALEIRDMAPKGRTDGKTPPAVIVANHSGTDWQGALRWQVRDTWGVVSAQGRSPFTVPAEGGTLLLEAVSLADAGRHFLDVWLDGPDGATIDWGSTFALVDRGAAPPVIASAHPAGAPRGAPLEGTVTVEGPPEKSTLRITLVDRYWREVGRAEAPLGTEPVAYRFPADGLDGQIWRVQADVLDPGGHLLARSFLNVTSPRGRDDHGQYRPNGTLGAGTTPEASARAEFLRRTGFIADRLYAAGSPILAEGACWTDLQLIPYVQDIRAASSAYKEDKVADWDEPYVREELHRAWRFQVEHLKRFGLRGFAQSDDSSSAKTLPLSPYITIGFHEWLRQKYGDFEAVCKAWDARPKPVATPPGTLPLDPYVILAFHEWLKAKHGSILGVAKAWGMKTTGFGHLRSFGIIEPDMIGEERNEKIAADVKAFLAEYSQRKIDHSPFGAINNASVKALYDNGCVAPWIDAQHYLAGRWEKRMGWLHKLLADLGTDMDTGVQCCFEDDSLTALYGSLAQVLPYYRDRRVKVAVSRGRMRRPGDFGATLGTYGEAPPQVRRQKPWALLFAGANSLYYWMMHLGLTPEITYRTKDSLYQCEAIEEIARGPGELFLGADRVFDPVAVFQSQTSMLCDQLEKKGEPLTSVDNSVGAFQDVLEDLGLNPHTVDAPDLLEGWLEKNRTRILLIGGANSMSDAETQVVRAFVEGGGIAVADSLPGRRLDNGRLRESVPLAEVFGVVFDLQEKTERVRGTLKGATAEGGPVRSFGEAAADPRVRAETAKSLGSVGEAQALFVHAFGKGKAYLLNTSFFVYASYRAVGGATWAPWYALMKQITEDAGVKPLLAGTSQGQATAGLEFSTFRNGKGFLLGVEDLGSGDFQEPMRPFEVALPRAYHIYDVRAGTCLGLKDTLSASIPRSGHRAYALLAYAVQGVTAELDTKTPRAGDVLSLRVDLDTGGAERDRHVVRIEAVPPGADQFFPYFRVKALPEKGPLFVLFHTSPDDPPGAWRFVVTDVATGASTTASFILAKGGAE